MNPQNQAMEMALGGGGQAPGGGAPPGSPNTPMPGLPPELVEMAYALGLDLQNPQDLMVLIQMLGGGGGGPLGPMAGAVPGGAGGQVPPQSY